MDSLFGLSHGQCFNTLPHFLLAIFIPSHFFVETKNKVREYILGATLSNIDSIADDTLIFESGLLDSMGLLFLIEFLKEEFDITTNDDELIVENFESINNIVGFIESKL